MKLDGMSYDIFHKHEKLLITLRLRNKMLINRLQRIYDVENYYQHLSTSSQGTSLQIPKKMDWKIGSKGAFIQFLITWSKMSPTESLITYINSEDQVFDQLNNLLETEHGLIACLVAPDVVMSNLKVSVKDQLSKCILKRLGALTGASSNIHGAKALYLCADEYSNEYLPPTLYFKNNVRPTEDFESLAFKLIERFQTFYPIDKENTDNKKVRTIGELLKELFINTDTWAKTDVNNIIEPKSVRGITFSMHDVSGESTPSNLVDAFGSEPIGEYLSCFESDDSEQTTKYFLEISVFDSGPGLAQRLLRRSIKEDDIKTEYDAVMDCLALHATSSSRFTKGYGLNDAMFMLTKLKGFWKLRSGRLSLYRDFAKNQYTVSDDENVEMLDWSNRSDKLTKMSFAEGALWTIILPFSSSN